MPIRLQLRRVARFAMVFGLIAATPAAGATTKLAPRTVSIPIRNIVLPVLVSGTLTWEPGGEKAEASGRIDGDLAAAQRQATVVLRALLDRNAQCGENIAVQTGSFTARAPSILVRASLFYERSTCMGGRSIGVVPHTAFDIEILLHPIVAPRSLTFRAEIVDLRSPAGALPEALRAPIRHILAAEVGRRIGNLFPSTAPPDAVLHSVAFEETRSIGLTVRVEGSATLTRSAIASLVQQPR